MNRRTWLATVGTVGSIAISGCTGSDNTDETDNRDDPDDSNNETDDEASTNDASETKSPLESFAYPEYASQDGISAADLVSAHFESIRDEGSVTVSTVDELTVDGHSSETTTEVKISGDGIRLSEDGNRRSIEQWTEHGTDRELLKRESGFQTVYQIANGRLNERRALSERTVSGLAEVASFGAATSVVEIEGVSAARYDITEVSESGSTYGSRFTGDEVEDVTGSFFVTEEGIVKRVQYELTVMYDGREHVDTTELTYTDVGSTTVTEPDWTETARQEGREFDATVTDDGYVAFELVNGNPISDGVTLSVHAAAGSGETTLPASIDVGDRLVVALSRDGLSAAVNEKPAANSNFDGNHLSLSLRTRQLVVYENDFEFFRR